MRASAASDGPLGCALLPLTAAIAGNISMRAYIQYEVAATKQQLHGTWPCVYDSPQELQLLSSANELAHSLGLRAAAAMTLTQLQADCAKHEQAHWLRHWHGKPPQHVQRPLTEIRQQATSISSNPNPNPNPDRICPICHSSTRFMYHARTPPSQFHEARLTLVTPHESRPIWPMYIVGFLTSHSSTPPPPRTPTPPPNCPRSSNLSTRRSSPHGARRWSVVASGISPAARASTAHSHASCATGSER